MKLVDVRTMTWSYMVGFENKLVQNDHHDKTKCHEQEPCHFIKGLCHSLHLNLCIYFSETCLCPPITWSSMLEFMNNVAQVIIMTRRCVTDKNHVASLTFKVIDYT